jgi:hypothetical protein
LLTSLQIQHVSPSQGSVLGGTEITITGGGFGTDKDKLSVEFGERGCQVKSVTDTQILCDTDPALNVDQLWSDYGESVLSFCVFLCPFVGTFVDILCIYLLLPWSLFLLTLFYSLFDN